jgi:hypothetical protein
MISVMKIFAFVAAVAKFAQQQIAPWFAPFLRHCGGASRVSRRKELRHGGASRASCLRFSATAAAISPTSPIGMSIR